MSSLWIRRSSRVSVPRSRLIEDDEQFGQPVFSRTSGRRHTSGTNRPPPVSRYVTVLSIAVMAVSIKYVHVMHRGRSSCVGSGGGGSRAGCAQPRIGRSTSIDERSGRGRARSADARTPGSFSRCPPRARSCGSDADDQGPEDDDNGDYRMSVDTGQGAEDNLRRRSVVSTVVYGLYTASAFMRVSHATPRLFALLAHALPLHAHQMSPWAYNAHQVCLYACLHNITTSPSFDVSIYYSVCLLAHVDTGRPNDSSSLISLGNHLLFAAPALCLPLLAVLPHLCEYNVCFLPVSSGTVAPRSHAYYTISSYRHEDRQQMMMTPQRNQDPDADIRLMTRVRLLFVGLNTYAHTSTTLPYACVPMMQSQSQHAAHVRASTPWPRR